MTMSHTTHDNHGHAHGIGCGHPRVKHDDHEDYLHDGHLHFVHGDHVDEHELAQSTTHPTTCAPHTCKAHDASHAHGPGCGHLAIPHAGHIDYVVDGHLHYPHVGHCDHHGAVTMA